MILIPISCTLIVAAGILLIVLFLAHRNCTSEILFTHTNGPNGGCSNRSPSHHTSVGTFSQQALHLLSQHQPGQLGFHETQCELLFFFTFFFLLLLPSDWIRETETWLPDSLTDSLFTVLAFFLSFTFTFSLSTFSFLSFLLSPSTLVFLLYSKVQIPFPNNTPPKLDEFHVCMCVCVCVCAVVSFNFICPSLVEKSHKLFCLSVVFFPPSQASSLFFLPSLIKWSSLLIGATNKTDCLSFSLVPMLQ